MLQRAKLTHPRRFFKPPHFFIRVSRLNILLPLFIFLFTSCENDIAKINLITAKSDLPLESGKNVTIIYSDSARIKIKIMSPLVDRYAGDKPHTEMPLGVKMEFYSDSMKIKSKLTADYAIRYDNPEQMEAKKNVVVVNEKGEQLNTEHLIWSKEKDLIYTEAFVKITTADEILYGDGLESNQDFSKYKIKNITGTINLHEEK